MNWPVLVIFIVYFYCFLVIIQAFKKHDWQKNSWILTSFFIICLTFILSQINSTLSSCIGVSLCLFLLAIPQWGFNYVNRLIETQKYRKASYLFSILFLLHPTLFCWQYLQLLFALKLANEGKIKAATKQLQSYYHAQSIIAYYSQIFAYKIQGNWSQTLQWLEMRVEPKILWQDSQLLTYYMRALGETGKLNQFFQNFPKVEAQLLKLKQLSKVYQIQLYAFAFTGQTIAVNNLFKQSLSFYPKVLQEFWLFTAEMAINPQKEVSTSLVKLCTNQNYFIKNALHWRLSNVPSKLEHSLNQNSLRTLYLLNARKKIYQDRLIPSKRKNQGVTQLLIAVNLLMFMIEISLGGSENLEILYQLGALVPMVVWQGQFWRLIAANFLHYGWLHLLMNMLGLYVIGSLLESISTRWRYFIIYFSSGIGAMFLFTYFAIYTDRFDYILVGASASIMGLVGSLTAIFLRQWWRQKSSNNFKRLVIMLTIISLQFMTDFFFPQVSILSHLFGLIIGFLIELMIGYNNEGDCCILIHRKKWKNWLSPFRRQN